MSWQGLVAVVLWGASFVAAKIALAELPPLGLVLLRAVLAALVLDLLLLQRGGWAESVRLTRRDWVRIGVLTLISAFPHQVAQMAGLQRTTAVNSALLVTLAPMFMFVLAVVLVGERPNWLKVAGFLLAILGSALVITRGDPLVMRVDGSTVMGDLLVVVSALGWALYSTVSKDVLRERSPLLVAALVFSLSLPVLTLSAASEGGAIVAAVRAASWKAWAAVIFLAWACSALAYILWYEALRQQDISRVGVLHYLQPLVTTVLGVLLLGEMVVWATALGGAMILGGVALVNRRQ